MSKIFAIERSFGNKDPLPRGNSAIEIHIECTGDKHCRCMMRVWRNASGEIETAQLISDRTERCDGMCKPHVRKYFQHNIRPGTTFLN